MATPPIRLLRPNAMKIDADTPCVLEMHIPIDLPHRLDPSLPAPPYHRDTLTAQDFLDQHAMPLLRQLMAQIVSRMFGPEHAAAALDAPTRATSESSCGLRLLARLNTTPMTSLVSNNNSNIAAGYWTDIFGNEYHGTAEFDAYEEDLSHGQLCIFREFIVYLVRGIRDANQLREMNPRAFWYNIFEQNGNEESEHELVFGVWEYTAEMRSRVVNSSLAFDMKMEDAHVTSKSVHVAVDNF